MLSPDVIADLKFYSTQKNGRNTPTPTNFFACIVVVNRDNHDARLLLDGIGSISPGERKKSVPIKFLCADLVVPKLNVGDKFLIRDGKVIGEGKVVEILNIKPDSTVTN